MSKILLTGATGYIGNKLLHELIETQDKTILVPVRADTETTFHQRKNDLLAKIPANNHEKIQCVHADLGNISDVLKDETKNLSQIIHNAAITAFNVDEAKANEINRDSSIAMMKMAQKCPALDKFIYVSTVYASGMSSGDIEEQFFTPQPEFANHYERSKWESEEALRKNFNDLPWVIARVATVIADSAQGNVIQQNAIHNTLKLFYFGLISLLPGFKTTPVYLVEGDFVAKSLNQISLASQAQNIYHVCHDIDSAVTLDKFIDIAFNEFNKFEAFSSRRLLKPLFVDEKSFDTLATNMKSFGGSVLSQGLSSVAPFGKQLFIKKNIKNESLRALIKNYQKPEMETIIARSCNFLAKTNFAKAK
ncbi:MAG: SDR family oxidoreductase [Bdellovibrio sp.]